MLGSGTLGDPYIIQDANDLQDMNLDLTAYYELGNDIDASGFVFTPIDLFTGQLDGNNWKIDNFTINIVGSTDSLYYGLFRRMLGLIKNVHMRHVVIDMQTNGSYLHACPLAETNTGTIENCSAISTINFDANNATGGTGRGGGITVINEGVISNCYSIVTINGIALTGAGRVYIGGISVANDASSIEECFSIVNITGETSAVGGRVYIGGICMDHDGSDIKKCFSFGEISAKTAAVVSYTYAGGLVQDNYGANTENSFARVKITTEAIAGRVYNGGFSAQNDDTITNSYSTGEVIATGLGAPGGFCGDDGGGVYTESFWDTETSGTLISDGGVGHNTFWMKTQANFEAAGWDFTSIWFIDPSWNDGYPCFQWFRDNVLAGDYDTDTMTELTSRGLIPAISPTISPTVTTLPVTGVS